MPPKKTDKNKIQEPVRTPQSFDVSRDPLPAVVPPCIPTTEDLDGYAPRVSDALFPEWAVEGLDDEDWHSVDDLFVDHDFGTEALPAWVRVETAGWVRACDFVQSKSLQHAEFTDQNNQKNEEKKGGGTRTKSKEGDHRVWVESDSDESTCKVLPRIVVLPQVPCDEASNGMDQERRWPPPRSLPLDRGFARSEVLETQSKDEKIYATEGGTSPKDTTSPAETGPFTDANIQAPSPKLADADTSPALSSNLAEPVQERDAIGCSLLRLVASYVEAKNAPFLWEAIFPQDANGRPCYNPGGKYAVKLFVSGLWRKVLVDDLVPIDFNGSATLVSSRERRELWPIILAKAMYKVANLMGCAASRDQTSNQVTSEIVAVAAMALTGWLPSLISGSSSLDSPWLPSTIDAFSARVTSGGTPNCTMEEIVLTATSGLPGSPFKRRHMKPGRRRRRARSREPSDEMLGIAASARNSAADVLRSKFTGAREELIIIIDFDHSAKTILRPVLAVTSSDERLEASDALLEWSCAHAQHADFKIGGIVPQPKTRLVSFEELLQSRATTCVVAMKTCRKMPFTAQARCHWVSDDGASFVPPAPLTPTILHVNATSKSATLIVALQADMPNLTAQQAEYMRQSNFTSPFAMRDVILTLAEISPPRQEPTTKAEPIRQNSLEKEEARASVHSKTKMDHEEPRMHNQNHAQSAAPSPLVSIRLALKLDRLNPIIAAALVVPSAPSGRLYRLSLDAPLGAVAIFCSNAPVACSDVSTIYTHLGGLAATCHGTYCAVHPGSQLVLFRRVVSLPKTPIAGGSPGEEKKSPRAKTPRETEEENDEGSGALDSKPKLPAESLFVDVDIELWLSDLSAAESVTLHTFDIDTSAATSHPLLRSQQMRIPRGGSGIVITAILCASRSQPVGIGDWSLLALSNMIDQSDGPSLEMKEVDAIQYCFGSSYEPNKNLRLFRDILDVPSVCFPLYISLDITQVRDTSDSTVNKCALDERLAVRFGIYEITKKIPRSITGPAKSDKDSLISAAKNTNGSKGCRILERSGMRTICIPCFWPMQCRSSAVANEATLSIQLVLEAELDSDILQVDQALCAPKPYTHNSSAIPAVVEHNHDTCHHDLSEQNQVDEMEVHWLLTLYAAAEGVHVRHDAEEEKARHALRKNWESNEPGREDRAAAVRAVLFKNSRATDLPEHQATLEEIANSRAEALGPKLITPELEANRESKRGALKFAATDVEAVTQHAVTVSSPDKNTRLTDQIDELSSDAGIKILERGRLENASQFNEEGKHKRKLLDWRTAFIKGTVNVLSIREKYRGNLQRKNRAIIFLRQKAYNAALEIAKQSCLEEQMAEVHGAAVAEIADDAAEI